MASCASSITILPQGSGVQTGVQFDNNRMNVPLAFSGSYSFGGCYQFSGWGQSNMELRFDQNTQSVYGIVNVETVSLDGVNPIISGLITPVVQSTINERVNPIKVVDGKQLAIDLPIAASGGDLKAAVKDVRAEVKDNARELVRNLRIQRRAASAGCCRSINYLRNRRPPFSEAFKYLHTHDLGLFVFGELVDLCDVRVRQLLNLVESVAFVVLGDLFVLELFFRASFAACLHVSNGDAMVLGEFVDLLCELLTPLFVKRRHGQPDDLAVIRRVKSEVGSDDRFFNGVTCDMSHGWTVISCGSGTATEAI